MLREERLATYYLRHATFIRFEEEESEEQERYSVYVDIGRPLVGTYYLYGAFQERNIIRLKIERSKENERVTIYDATPEEQFGSEIFPTIRKVEGIEVVHAMLKKIYIQFQVRRRVEQSEEGE